jgi:hypothetical protein
MHNWGRVVRHPARESARALRSIQHKGTPQGEVVHLRSVGLRSCFDSPPQLELRPLQCFMLFLASQPLFIEQVHQLLRGGVVHSPHGRQDGFRPRYLECAAQAENPLRPLLFHPDQYRRHSALQARCPRDPDRSLLKQEHSAQLGVRPGKHGNRATDSLSRNHEVLKFQNPEIAAS